MITDKLKELLATRIKDIVDVGKLGMGGNTTSPLALDLDVPITGTPTISVEKSNSNVVQIMVEEVGSNITGKLIREMGFFDGTEMLGRINFEAVGPFSETERIQIFLTLEVE
tara:strand:- start:1796 stop:2131 length:336 start_codon:yes stop_codon:yes gene_type:complete